MGWYRAIWGGEAVVVVRRADELEDGEGAPSAVDVVSVKWLADIRTQ
jgi:hypothetical protein